MPGGFHAERRQHRTHALLKICAMSIPEGAVSLQAPERELALVSTVRMRTPTVRLRTVRGGCTLMRHREPASFDMSWNPGDLPSSGYDRVQLHVHEIHLVPSHCARSFAAQLVRSLGSYASRIFCLMDSAILRPPCTEGSMGLA